MQFDLVIAMQDVAIEFLNDRDHPLFPDTPVVFLTNMAGMKRRANSTGVLNERNYVPTVDLIRRLQPDVRNVFVVTGAAAADEEFKNEIRRQMPSYDSQLQFTYLSGLPTKELEERLSRLPAHSAVFQSSSARMATETSFFHSSTSIEYPVRRTRQPTAGSIPRWATGWSVAASTAKAK